MNTIVSFDISAIANGFLVRPAKGDPLRGPSTHAEPSYCASAEDVGTFVAETLKAEQARAAAIEAAEQAIAAAR
jgi:hypothetical protein